MGKDNQDYFKRAGRSGGPAGPLHLFRQKLGQERAVLSRGQERGFPGHRPPTYHPPGEPPQVPGERAPGTNGGGQEPRGAARDEQRTEARPTAEHEPRTHVPQTETQSFGPPADYDAAVGRGPGTQEIPPGGGGGLIRDLGKAVGALLERSPRPFQRPAGVARWVGRRLQEPAKRALSMADRFRRTLDVRR